MQVLLRPILANKHSALHWDAIAAQILLWNVIGIVVIFVWSAGCSIIVFWSLDKAGLLRVRLPAFDAPGYPTRCCAAPVIAVTNPQNNRKTPAGLLKHPGHPHTS